MKKDLKLMTLRSCWPARNRILAIALSTLVLAIGAEPLHAANVTYIVGTCRSGTRFSTIQAALNASPAPNTVQVCPGQYPEQITITKPVTLQGISVNNQAQARIVTPAGGLLVNASVNSGEGVPDPAAVQIYVKDVNGPVNLANLDINGIANGQSGSGAFVIGVLYQQTSGTINHIVSFNQNGQSTVGWGIFLEGGSTNPSITVENSVLHDFSQGAIWAIGDTTTPDLTVTIKGNYISSSSQTTYNVVAEEGINATISGNVITGGLVGINVTAPEGTVSGNTIIGSLFGIDLNVDGVSLRSNNIEGTVDAGITIFAPSLSTSAVQNNIIRSVTNPNQGGGTGIDLNCKSISSSLVHSNTIMDALFGYGDAPTGFAGANTYVEVGTEIDVSCN
jgi:hypothetical protein